MNHKAKLTEGDIAVIRRRIVNGEPCSVIAKDFDVAGSTILSIRDGKTWRHIK